MSYTTSDYVHDLHFPVSAPSQLIEEMVEQRLVVMRRADVEALVAYAIAHGLDASGPVPAAGSGDDPWNIDPDAALAVSNWEKDRIDWQGDG